MELKQELVTVKMSSGVTAKLDLRNYSSSIKLAFIERCLNSNRYNTELAYDTLKNLLGKRFDHFLSQVSNLGVEEETLDLLYDAAIMTPNELKSAFRSVRMNNSPGSCWIIPDNRYIQALANVKTDGVGCGEVLFHFLFDESSAYSSGHQYDVFVPINTIETNLHMKDCRNDDATPMGNPRNADASFFETPIMLFFKQSGLDVRRLQANSFQNNEKLEALLKERYKTNDLKDAARMMYEELNEALQNSLYLGDVAGIVKLKLDDKLYFEFQHITDVCFNETGGRGIKVSSYTTKFIDSIMYRTNALESARLIAEKKRARDDAESIRLSLKKAKSDELNERKKFKAQIKLEQIESLKLEAIKKKWRSLRDVVHITKERRKHKSLAATSRALGIGTETIKRKLKIYENRNHRRSIQTMHTRALGVDQASIEGK